MLLLGASALLAVGYWAAIGRFSDELRAARSPFAIPAFWSHGATTPGIVAGSVALMQQRFSQAGFRLAAVREGVALVPRLFLAQLPGDMPGLDDPDQRKAVFIKVLLPLILAVDEAAADNRGRLIELAARERQRRPITPAERRWLADLARHYGGSVTDLDDLLARVDIVPPSLALAQAAEETGWGTSRLVLQQNALFGQQEWSPTGLASARAFAWLGGSVTAYIHNLNTHPAYAGFRAERARLRAEGKPLDGEMLVRTLLSYSERRADYIAALRRIIRGNALSEFDAARLQADPPEAS